VIIKHFTAEDAGNAGKAFTMYDEIGVVKHTSAWG